MRFKKYGKTTKPFVSDFLFFGIIMVFNPDKKEK